MEGDRQYRETFQNTSGDLRQTYFNFKKFFKMSRPLSVKILSG